MLYSKNDVLLMYEHTVRELDSLVLLKEIIKKRGYKAEITDIVYARRRALLRAYPDLVLVPFLHCVMEKRLIPFDNMYGKQPLLVNLHWEQLGSAASQSFLVPKDNFSREVFHVSWSDKFTNFLITQGKVNRELIWQTGNPKADLLTKNFRKAYISCSSLKHSLNIPNNAPFYLFIMSFSSAFVNEKYIGEVEKKGGFLDFKEFARITYQSYKSCMNEIKKLAKFISKDGAYLLLRPHPITPLAEIKKMVSCCDNIRVSRDFPLHEVIYNSKGVISWLSTGTIDAYILDKPTVILRPNKIPDKYDMDMLKGFTMVSDAKTAYEALTSKPVFNKSLLDRYVDVIYGTLDGCNTIRLANKIIEQLSNIHNTSNTVRKKGWWKEFFAYMTKDVPKNYLAKYFPDLLPMHLKGRLDDRYTPLLAELILRKYSKVLEQINL